MVNSLLDSDARRILMSNTLHHCLVGGVACSFNLTLTITRWWSLLTSALRWTLTAWTDCCRWRCQSDDQCAHLGISNSICGCLYFTSVVKATFYKPVSTVIDSSTTIPPHCNLSLGVIIFCNFPIPTLAFKSLVISSMSCCGTLETSQLLIPVDQLSLFQGG